MELILYIIAVPIVLLTLCVLFKVNYQYEGKNFSISIKTR